MLQPVIPFSGCSLKYSYFLCIILSKLIEYTFIEIDMIFICQLMSSWVQLFVGHKVLHYQYRNMLY